MSAPPRDGVDHAHTQTANANRARKAAALSAAAAWCGATDPGELTGPGTDPDIRKVVASTAGIARASEETWAAAAADLAAAAPTVCPPGARPLCSCTPHPVTHVLYEAFVRAPDPATGTIRAVSGWLCPHRGQAPTLAATLAATSTSPAWEPDPDEGTDEGTDLVTGHGRDDGDDVEPAWAQIAAAAGLVERRARVRR